jgi:hypothetical protein
MSFKLNLRLLGVFQPDTQIGKRLARLTGRAHFSGLYFLAQSRHHFANGPQLLRDGLALKIKRAAGLFCSDQNHAILPPVLNGSPSIDAPADNGNVPPPVDA